MDWILPVIIVLAYQIPLIIVHIVGIVLASTRRGLYPGNSNLVMIAFCIFLASLLVFPPVAIFIPYFVSSRGLSSETINLANAILNLLRSLAISVGLVLLFIAIFSRREETKRIS